MDTGSFYVLWVDGDNELCIDTFDYQLEAETYAYELSKEGYGATIAKHVKNFSENHA